MEKAPAPDATCKTDMDLREALFHANKKLIESIELMEEKVYCASMQIKVSVILKQNGLKFVVLDPNLR